MNGQWSEIEIPVEAEIYFIYGCTNPMGEINYTNSSINNSRLVHISKNERMRVHSLLLYACCSPPSLSDVRAKCIIFARIESLTNVFGWPTNSRSEATDASRRTPIPYPGGTGSTRVHKGHGWNAGRCWYVSSISLTCMHSHNDNNHWDPYNLLIFSFVLCCSCLIKNNRINLQFNPLFHLYRNFFFSFPCNIDATWRWSMSCSAADHDWNAGELVRYALYSISDFRERKVDAYEAVFPVGCRRSSGALRTEREAASERQPGAPYGSWRMLHLSASDWAMERSRPTGEARLKCCPVITISPSRHREKCSGNRSY